MENYSKSGKIENHEQLLNALKIAVNSSKQSLFSDGILLIFWGLALSVSFLWKYIENSVLTAFWMRQVMTVFIFALTATALILTVYFIFIKKNKLKTYAAISTRFVWIGVVIAHNLIVLVIKAVLNTVDFQLLHPIQMVLIGFALFITGGIYRYYILTVCGVVMWAAALLAAGYEMNTQYLIRAISDFVCFVLPGIFMFTSLKNRSNV